MWSLNELIIWRLWTLLIVPCQVLCETPRRIFWGDIWRGSWLNAYSICMKEHGNWCFNTTRLQVILSSKKCSSEQVDMQARTWSWHCFVIILFYCRFDGCNVCSYTCRFRFISRGLLTMSTSISYFSFLFFIIPRNCHAKMSTTIKCLVQNLPRPSLIIWSR